MKGGLLQALNTPARRPFLAAAIAAAVALLALLSTLRLRPDPSPLKSLFPPSQPAAAALNRWLEDFPTAGELLVLVTTPDGKPGDEPDPDRLLSFANRFEQEVASDPKAKALVTGVKYRADAQMMDYFQKVVVPNGLFYLDDAEFDAALRRLTRPEMEEQLRQDEAMLATPGPAASALAKVLLQDPLRLREFIMRKLAEARPVKSYQNSDAFLSEDGRSLLIRVSGAKSPSDLSFCDQITTTVAALTARANTDHLTVELSGAYPIAAQSQRSIRRDSISGTVGSVVCLALLFLLMFRRSPLLFAATFLPVALGILCGFGVYALFSRSVTPLTAVIGAVLAGIGIDYAIFYLVHYQERRAAGAGSEQAARDTLGTIGGALVAAWVTSVTGFVAVTFTTVRALRDFAMVGSIGLAGALLCAVFLLPALLVILDRLRVRRKTDHPGSEGPGSALAGGEQESGSVGPGVTGRGGASKPAARFSMHPLLRWINRRAGACMIVWLVVMGAAALYLAVAGPWLELEPDPTVLHPRPNPPLDAEAHIARRMGMAPDSLIVHLSADNPDQLLAMAHRVNEELTGPAGREAGVAKTFGLATLLPDPAVAARRMTQVGPALADRVVADFDAAVSQSSFDPKAYEGYRGFLRVLLTPQSAPGVADLVRYPSLAGSFLPRKALEGEPAREAITLVFLSRSMDTPAEREALVGKVRGLLADVPGATPTGMSVLSLDLQETIHHDLPRLTIVAVVICALYLLIHFRSPTQTLLAVLPTLCSLTCLLTVARLAGAKMNLANIVSVPLLIGIDIDYGIFLVSVARRSTTRADLLDRAAASSRAVILCAAATLLGFGSLAFTSVPAVRSLGWAVAIGVCTCAAAALFLLLPLLLWLRGRAERWNGSGASASPHIERGAMRQERQDAKTAKEYMNRSSFLASWRPWHSWRLFKRKRGSKRYAIAGCISVLLLYVTGCAPSVRLSFPARPISRANDTEWFDVRHNGRRQFGIVHEPDGRVDRLLYCDEGDGRVDREYRLSDYANERVPHLILLLDSIPFETVRERYEAGDFRWFGPPQKMISPFPSMTQVAYSDVLHCPPLIGTSDQSFDPRTQKKRNNQWNRIWGDDLPYERRLTYRADFLGQALAYLDPDDWYKAELEQARRAVEKAPDRVTIAYLGSASSMVCKFGKPGAERVLDGARQLCLQLLYERRGAIKISMMADHGHNYTRSKNVSLEKLLEDAGFHPADRIRGPLDCVVDINALVTFAGVHTTRPEAVAKALCAHEAIELAIYQEGPRSILRTARGAAAVECRGGRLRYVPIDADVLDYGPTLERLKAEGKMDADGYAADDTWFRATLDHYWPNAPRRAWDALHGKVISPPTVMLSLKDGFYAGDPSYENYITMASTHGGMNQVNSATFVLTMTGRLHEAVRHEDVLGKLEPGFQPPVRRD